MNTNIHIPQKVVRRLEDNRFVVESKKGKKYIVDCLKGVNPNLIIENEYYYIDFHFSPQYRSNVGYLTVIIVKELL